MLPAELERLPNGLRLVTIPDSHAESVTFAVSVETGSRYEKPKYAGASHFIEHMLFKGTGKRTVRDINRAVESRGGSFNAYTGEEGTTFYAKLPCEFMPVAVDVICDMYANATFPEKEFDRERNVILQELKMYEDDPGSVAGENLSRCLFPGNALGLPVGGSEAALLKMTADGLRRYCRRAYVPSATVVAVTGNFDPGDIRALVSESLGRMGRGRPMKYEKFDLGTPVERELTVAKDVHQTQVALGWRLPFGVRDKRRYVVSVVNSILGGGMSSRLFETVREKRGLSYDISSSAQLFGDVGMMAVAGGVEPCLADAMIEIVLREIEKLKSRKVGQAELRRVKDYLTGHFRLSFEQPFSRIMYYSGSVFAHDRIVAPEIAVENMEAVTADDVLEFAGTFLVPQMMAVSKVVPK